jgi:non-specific serine/threonine protein kinase
MRALIDWSHALLSAPEKALFRRLAVFPGRFALPAAESIAANGEVARDDVLDLLARLVEKSLVVLAADGSHHRMLETIREYAAEQLAASDEPRAVRDRLLCYCVDVAEATWRDISGPGQVKANARLDFERENLLAAHAWCDVADDGPEMGVRLSYPLKSYWINRGLSELGHRIAREALARTAGQGRTLLRCRALFNAGQVACVIGRYAEARHDLEESLAIARELGDAKRVAAALQPLGTACLGLGDFEAARRHLEEALVLARAQNDVHDLTGALTALAQFHRARGEVYEAIPLYEEALALARRMGDRESVAIGLLNVAMATIAARGDGDAAAMLREVLAIVDETGSKPALQSLFEVSSGLAAAQGEATVAAEIFGVAEALAGRTGLTRDPADEAFLAPRVARCRRTLGDAAFAAAEARGRVRRPDDALAQVRTWLASASGASRG